MDRKAEIKKNFGERLLELDAQLAKANNSNPSLRALASRSGLEYSHVQRISKGKVDVSLTTIFALAQGLNLSPFILLDFEK